MINPFTVLKSNKPLNSDTPQWFKDWHSREFLKIKIRQDFMILIGVGLFVAIITSLVIK